VELIAALVLLYGLQCVVWLPGGACLFTGTPFGWVSASGPGFRLLHPRPAARTWLASRFPLIARDGRLHGRGAATWLSDRGVADGGPCELAGLRAAELHGTVVRVAGRPFARGSDPADAERIAALLRELADAEPAQREPRIAAELARSHSLAGLREARRRFEQAAKWLGWTSDAYFVGLFGLLPVAMWMTGNDYAIRLLVPALIAVHVATCVALARTHGRLRPGRRGERAQILLGAALYPPSLLRAYQQLHAGALASFAPAAVAAEVLPRELAHAFLRGELVRSALGAQSAGSSGQDLDLGRLEVHALRELVRELGESPDGLRAAPPRSDPLALSYCPACRSEYRRADGSCSDCEVPLEAYPGLR
jgi:hypothetical protein